MSQALHTASTGINAGQYQINVIANNVANINTTAFKAANMTFETLYSNNLSYGSAATKTGGGTNPKQIGLGVKVGGITRNFNPGDFVNTGRDMDLMISGNGFFVVQDADGKIFYTRDGVFSTDSDGNVVTQNGLKVVAASTSYSNASSGKTVQVPKNFNAHVYGDPDAGLKRLSQLNNALITPGDIEVTVNGKPVTLTVAEKDPTLQTVLDDFNTKLKSEGINDVEFICKNGVVKYEPANADITFDSATTNFVAQTGVANKNSVKEVSQIAELQELINYDAKNGITLKSTSVDEKGILSATYSDGSILTQYLDDNFVCNWKYITPEGVTILGDDVKAEGSTINESNFVIELATMVNEEGMVSIHNNLWEWAADVGDVYYGMAGQVSFGTIESGGYEGSNVDIATELTNMISAQRMIQMNSRVFSTASSVMETLAYLGN